MIDLLTFGETMVSIRTKGPLVPGASATAHIAGAESNVAIGLARLGHSVSWVGVLGNDLCGDSVLRALSAEQVDTADVRREDSRPTATMLLEARTADLSRVAYNRIGAAGSSVSYEDLAAPLSRAPRLLHLTGITAALGRGPRDALTRSLAERLADTTVSLDVNYRARLWSRDEARSVLTTLVDGSAGKPVDVVIASEDELDLLSQEGMSEEDTLGRLFAAGVVEVVVKRGPAGASWRGADGSDASLPARAVHVIDPVGAGDALVAGYLSGWLDGIEPERRLQRGIDCASFCISTRGDWEGLPYRSELGLLPGPGADPTLR